MFVDSDISLTPGCISTLLSDMMRFGWDGVHASVRSSCNETYWQRAEDINISLFFNRPGASVFNSLAAALFRREVLRETPFDPSFVESGEDVDLCMRLHKAGKSLGISKAVAFHNHRRTFMETVQRRFRWGKGQARLAFKQESPGIMIAPLSEMLLRSIYSIATGNFSAVPYFVVCGVSQLLGIISFGH
jgi:GT2 family glycosyltransferase